MVREHVEATPETGTGGQGAPGPRLSSSPPRSTWQLRSATLDLTSPQVMGILNLTPDSFSDGGDLATLGASLRRAEEMVRAGATVLDVGGESTRPGAGAVDAAEERQRILPFLEEAAGTMGVPISVDTRKAEVARAALEAGAEIVNDVSAFRHDSSMAEVVREHGAGVVLMHMRGDPDTMMEHASYQDLLGEIAGELMGSVELARSAGIADERIVLDPGVGFAKTPEQNLILLRELDRLLDLGFPLLVGPSRKRFLGELLGVEPKERVAGTVAACVAALMRGARIFRVHDVEPVAQALKVMEAIEFGSRPDDDIAGADSVGQNVGGTDSPPSQGSGPGGVA